MNSPAVDALNGALLALEQLRKLAPAAGLIEGDIGRVIHFVEQGRDVLVQTEQDLRTSSQSALAAHKKLNALELYVADARRTLQELGIRESIALQNHTERVKLVNNLRARDPEPRENALASSFAVSTDAPRPVAAGVR